ncbi:MAG: protein translocase SEC61 complex subunit gamma [Thaumarchaeota archaeon]|jgi:protein translocase SEC61 complex gamma subunit|nr:MAG: protein translocase SEC61 complex subunit gamma [Nitrososphaerota archaeon]TMQ01049.1 MAG: protein translocase SEC61 complex subunit gamma [Nitrososphaerota archaeon]
MGARDFLRSMQSVFRLSKKSDRDEFMLYLKLVSLGVLIIGMIGFLIKFISAAFPAIFG